MKRVLPKQEKNKIEWISSEEGMKYNLIDRGITLIDYSIIPFFRKMRAESVAKRFGAKYACSYPNERGNGGLMYKLLSDGNDMTEAVKIGGVTFAFTSHNFRKRLQDTADSNTIIFNLNEWHLKEKGLFKRYDIKDVGYTVRIYHAGSLDALILKTAKVGNMIEANVADVFSINYDYLKTSMDVKFWRIV